MMTLVLILGGGLGWIVHRAHEQRAAVAALKSSIGTIQYDWQFKDGRRIQNGKPWEPRWLVDLLGVDYFHDVTMISFSDGLTDADMACLGKLTRIDTLALNPSNVSDVGLTHLSRLTSLRWLSIHSSFSSTDALVVRLQRHKVPSRLRGLNLDRSDVTDSGLKHLDHLPDLELLGLDGTGVTDMGLGHLGRLTALYYLFLNDTQVSDEGLVHLKGMVNLARLHLKGTKVTAAGVSELKKALPKVEISW
jgi:hypothetical protein